MKRAVALALLIACSCGARGAAMRDSLAQCELGQLPAALQGLAVDATAVLFAGASWESQLQGLAAQAGAAQLNCVVQAIGAGLRARAVRGQVTGEYGEAVRRADTWLATHK